jgi:[ribosomal protein S5]-alanine N-acetyltransferase
MPVDSRGYFVNLMCAPTIIETERLTLRQFTPNDAPFFLALVNDPDWLLFIGDRNVHSDAAARAYLAKHYLSRYEKDGFGFYLTSLKSTGEPMGMCGLIKREGLDDVDIGFAFLPAFRGRGYALEAAQASLEYARDVLKMKRVVAIATPDNVSSIALLKKIGLRFEGEVRLPHDPDPLVLYAINFGK